MKLMPIEERNQERRLSAVSSESLASSSRSFFSSRLAASLLSSSPARSAKLS
jgi:hypothetical protein